MFSANHAVTGGWDGNAATSHDITDTLAVVSKIITIPSMAWTADFFFDKNFLGAGAGAKSRYTRSIIRFGELEEEEQQKMGDWVSGIGVPCRVSILDAYTL